MIELTARVVVYMLLVIMCLLAALVAFGIGALFGSSVGFILCAVVQVVAPAASHWSSMFSTGGAMLGGGTALLLLARLLVWSATANDDPLVRSIGQYFDELSRAVKRPR